MWTNVLENVLEHKCSVWVNSWATNTLSRWVPLVNQLCLYHHQHRHQLNSRLCHGMQCACFQSPIPNSSLSMFGCCQIWGRQRMSEIAQRLRMLDHLSTGLTAVGPSQHELSHSLAQLSFTWTQMIPPSRVYQSKCRPYRWRIVSWVF